MSYLTVFKINTHYQDGRDLTCTAEIHREDRTSKNYGLPLMCKSAVSELG